jgi:hypothetical protein
MSNLRTRLWPQAVTTKVPRNRSQLAKTEVTLLVPCRSTLELVVDHELGIGSDFFAVVMP